MSLGEEPERKGGRPRAGSAGTGGGSGGTGGGLTGGTGGGTGTLIAADIEANEMTLLGVS